ncbi:MAG: 30S ribosome-binding factor RbfA [candidate division KSB1 bacterium]|nr:30S ribosome-binding factor RbfA [candidate division KSB1 bacterium]
MSYLPYKRADRVAVLLREEISRVIFEELKDPRVGHVTITRVRLTDDLKYARVYFNVLGGAEKAEQCRAGLERAKGFIRNQIRMNTDLRFIPDLEFRYDDTLDYSERIEELLREIHRPREE